MRVAQSEIYRTLLSDFASLNEDLSKVSSQISSGKSLNHLKDSPAGSAALVSLAKLDADVDQYLSNTDAGSLYMGIADSALNEAANLVTSIYSKGSQAVSETITDETRSIIAGEVRSLREQIVSLANSEVRGRYIFAGSMVTEPPFVIEGDNVTYRGDSRVNTLSVDIDMDVQMNFSGEDVFGPVFEAINSLLTALDGNDMDAVQTALNQFTPSLSAFSLARAQVGSSMNALENVQARLHARETSLAAQRSKIEDTDMAQAAVQLQQTQTALDAAVSAASSILTQRNLFDILG
jgi:flagellar hook-associated protein 3 FlgL